MTTQGPVDADAFTAPFMLTKAMHRDVYPAIDPINNPAISAEGKVVVVRGGTGGIGFVSFFFSGSMDTGCPGKQIANCNHLKGHRPVFPLRRGQGCCARWTDPG